MNNADRKEVFEKVKNHLLQQNEKSFEEDQGCLYRNHENGNKCAIGFLISDKYYSNSFESNTIGLERIQEAVSKSLGKTLNDLDIGMLRDLQEIHDEAPVSLWKEELEEEKFQHYWNPIHDTMEE